MEENVELNDGICVRHSACFAFTEPSGVLDIEGRTKGSDVLLLILECAAFCATTFGRDCPVSNEVYDVGFPASGFSEEGRWRQLFPSRVTLAAWFCGEVRFHRSKGTEQTPDLSLNDVLRM